MKRRDFIRTAAVAGAATALRPALGWAAVPGGRSTRLDTGWRFHLGDVAGAERAGFDDRGWERVTLPHTARIESLVTEPRGTPTNEWQGICWYHIPLRLAAEDAGKTVFLRFEAAMNVAEVWLDGERVGGHMGGWLPFVIDLTGRMHPGRESVLAVRLDNRDNPITGPKPLHLLDFNSYHGLYRYVHLVVKHPLHITDPIGADKPASGGVFVTYPWVSSGYAIVRVQAHLRNGPPYARSFNLRVTLVDPDGRVAAHVTSPERTLRPGGETEVVQELEVTVPRLWSPREPNLYLLRCEVLIDGAAVDVEETRIGIRRISITRDGFHVNDEKLFLRGTNRHQEYPYVGYAVPEAAQYRDARKIKEAGFDYVRLSHYAHAPAFMDACDELGIVVMNSIPGWQYFGPDPAFAELQYRNVRDLIRRDRNHPCVVMWETSLNETAMPPEFIARTHAIAHQEYPGDQCYTAGWTYGYDVFIQARQHGGCTREAAHPCVVSEYGDWEYYAMTAGLNQEGFTGLTPAESNSRQLRWQGEQAQLQQAANFQEAHNDNLGTAAFADGLWVMYDYNRGYAPDIESSGCMDIFRIPKYAYHFFRSQRSLDEALPMVFIASEWTAESFTDVRVFSNCDEVELRLNGRTVERRRPDRDRMSTHLAHPPFTFRLGTFTPGELYAIGYRNGEEVTRAFARTPRPVAWLRLSVDDSGRDPSRTAKDLLFCRAEFIDSSGGTVVASVWENVAFGTTGGLSLVGANPMASDAGIASILLQTEPGAALGAVYALSILRGRDSARVLGASAQVTDNVSPYEIRCTTDGSTPGPESPPYAGPIAGDGPVRAALLVAGRVVVTLDERAPKFRVPASAPPEAREPFRHG
ncbi:MAG TPA: glycoside hydrolase family 2 TIM barrel-domain containing protein [Longimicrobiaceae bacterium]|nr:glycoside hydrolase family 2 TIM barrel-domain containing protein [Longimicrobiaceae bacterium]